jgi:hypothetical protein
VNYYNGTIMKKIYIEMPDGYPFDLGFIEKHLSPKETYAKLKKAGAFKQSGSFKNFNVEALKRDIKFHDKLSVNPKTSHLQAVWFITFLRQALFTSVEPRWGSSACPEWKLLDLYCESRFNKPFYSLDSDYVLLDDIIAQNNADTDALDGFFKTTAETINFQNTFFKDLSKMNKDGVPFHHAVKMTGIILKDIKENRNVELAIQAAWALSTIANNPMVLTTILAIYPEHASYLEGLRWIPEEEENEHDCPYNEVLKDLKVYEPKFNMFLDREQQVSIVLRSKYSKLTSSITDLGRVVTSIKDDSGVGAFASEIVKVDSAVDEIKSYLSTTSSLLIDNSVASLNDVAKFYADVLEKANALHPEAELKDAAWAELFKAIDKYRELCPDELIKKLGVFFVNHQIQGHVDVISGQVDDVQSVNDQINKLSLDGVKNRVALSKKFTEYDERLTVVDTSFVYFANNFKAAIEKVSEITLPKKSQSPTVKNNELDEANAKLSQAIEKNTLLESNIDTYKREKIELSEQLHKEQLKTASVNVIAKAVSSGGDDWIRDQMRSGELTIPQVLSATEAIYGDRIVILDSVKSLASSVVFKRHSRLSELLFQLCDEYAPSIASGMADAEARKCFSANAYAAGESDSTLGIARLKKIRMHDYNGTEYLFDQHLRSGNSSNATQSLRVYFKIIDGVVVISHVGEHLECYTTI